MRSALLRRSLCTGGAGESGSVAANDYNPNVMAPGEKKLLKQSLEKDGSDTTGGGV